MANIGSLLQKILDAVYGEEVRGSIHDAISAMNDESSRAIQYASTAKDSAQASAANAQRSAATATQKASDAAASADMARLSETNAKNAETVASQKAADATASATGAKASELAAEFSSATAAQKADAAASSALSAQQYSGKPPKPQDGTWWVWDADQQKYVDTGIGCELVGPTGNGIEEIKLTKGDHIPGTTDIYTVTMTDGTTTTISVYNGRNGTGAGDVLGIPFDLVLPASGWVNGEITIADSRLLALATHKYLVDADEASREEYLECNVQARDITTTGFITFKNDTDPTIDLTVNVVRLELSANGA